MKTRAILAIALLCLVAAVSAEQQKKVQNVRLTADGSTYIVTPSTVTKDVPVKMDVDLDTVKGCLRTVVISAFNVKKTVKTGDTTIEFTPTKTGKIDVVCGMNMGKGTFTVTEPPTAK